MSRLYKTKKKIVGSDINVPPPTVNNDNNISPLGPNDVDDGQYREDPSIYYRDDKYNTEPVKTVSQPARLQSNSFETNFKTNNNQFQPQSRFRLQQQPEYQSQSYQQQNQFQNQQYQQQPSFEGRQFQQQQYQPSYQPSSQADLFRGHPATQFDINTGSYSVSYTG